SVDSRDSRIGTVPEEDVLGKSDSDNQSRKIKGWRSTEYEPF
ncbi:hypothetical protein HMPREF9473_01629, partial [, partial [Hungatella hathewayi WAL-18680]